MSLFTGRIGKFVDNIRLQFLKFTRSLVERKVWNFYVLCRLLKQTEIFYIIIIFEVARLDFSGPIWTLTTLPLTTLSDKDKNLLWAMLRWYRSHHSNKKTSLSILLAGKYLGTGCFFFPQSLTGACSSGFINILVYCDFFLKKICLRLLVVLEITRRFIWHSSFSIMENLSRNRIRTAVC